MSSPPFRLASAAAPLQALSAAMHLRAPVCCETHDARETLAEAADAVPTSHARLRLHQLHSHFHCSVIGTCLGTTELRKLIERHAVLDRKASDQDVHSCAVGLAEQAGEASKALHKALDRRHAAALAVFAKARDSTALAALWAHALDRGEIPGAYWALLTHHDTDDALRSKAFGDVHMLSHLVGASNRADIRRLVAMEQANAELVDRCERQQARLAALVEERDRLLDDLRRAHASQLDSDRGAGASIGPVPEQAPASTESLMRQIAFQTERREKAEQRSTTACADAQRAVDALAEMQSHDDMLGRELAAAEAALRQVLGDGDDVSTARLEAYLQGRRIAYIGGRPSSTPAIRSLVQRYGGRFAHHDGGIEDRKGLLTSTIIGADLVAFPMDCIDHDSVNMIKRLCARHGVAFLALRTASAASLMAALSRDRDDDGDAHRGPICLKHG